VSGRRVQRAVSATVETVIRFAAKAAHSVAHGKIPLLATFAALLAAAAVALSFRAGVPPVAANSTLKCYDRAGNDEPCGARECIRIPTERPNNRGPSAAKLDHDRALSAIRLGDTRSRPIGKFAGRRTGGAAQRQAAKTRSIRLPATFDTVLLLRVAERRDASGIRRRNRGAGATGQGTPLAEAPRSRSWVRQGRPCYCG
jgi:hypothetical protein